MKTERINNIWKIFAVLLPVGVLFYIYVYLTPFYRDDYSYMYSYFDRTQITSFSDILYSMYGHYYNMNGRIVTHFIGQVFLLIGKSGFNYINTCGFLVLGLLIYLNAYKTLNNVRMLPLMFTYVSLFLYSPAFGESYLWLIGSSNYMWGILIIMAFFLPYRLNLDNIVKSSAIKTIFASVGMLIFGFIAGGTNENTSIALIVMIICVLIYRVLKYKSTSAWMISGLVGSILGCIFMMCAPSQLDRLDKAGGLSSIFSFKFIKEFIVSSLALIREFSGLFIFISILLVIYLQKKPKHSKCNKVKMNICDIVCNLYINYFQMILYFCGFIVSFYSLTVLLYFPERTWSGPLVLLTTFLLCLFKEVSDLTDAFDNLFCNCCIGITLIALTGSVYFQNFFLLRDVYRDYSDRTAIVEQQLNENKASISIPSIYSSSKYSCYSNAGDLNDDPTFWTNTQLARYYGVKEVIKIE